jgi:cytochrome b6-f complex iron-sulfur subunit
VSNPTDRVTDSRPLSTRRQFCAHACQAASLLAVGALAGCGGSPTSPSGIDAPPLATVAATVTGRVVSIALDSATALSGVGSAAMVQTSLGRYLVAHTGQDTYTALNGTCTHEANPVTGYSGGRYVCIFHGSQFTTSGAVAVGPANRALTQYPTQVSGTTLTFTV